MPRRRSTMRGGGGSLLTPAPLAPNSEASPDLFSNSSSFVENTGCPYNYHAAAGAAGKLTQSPYVRSNQSGGNGCAAPNPSTFKVMGPGNGGGGAFRYSICSDGGSRPLSLGAGGQAPVSQSGGRRRRRRRTRRRTRRRIGRRTRRRIGRRRRRFHKGTKSKTHKGKDFETRKTSKRYGEKRWRKYLRGRKTLRSPIFPFAGGYRYSQKRKSKSRRRTHRKQRGGNNIIGSNIPNSNIYSLGGSLPGGASALASPPPVTVNTNCMPNGFPIRD